MTKRLTLKHDAKYGFILADAESGENIENVAHMTSYIDASSMGLIEVSIKLFIRAADIIDKEGQIVHEI
jgi:hypothetical protein